jgi:acetylornithine/succinyldiaminopimelate/putrescine aminotransferase
LAGPIVGFQGAGFLLGLKTATPAKDIQAKLLAQGILCGTSGDPNILRLLPPYTLQEEHVDLLAKELARL